MRFSRYPIDFLEQIEEASLTNALMEGATIVAEVAALVHEQNVINAAVAATTAGAVAKTWSGTSGSDPIDDIDAQILTVIKAARYGSLMGVGVLFGAGAWRLFKNAPNVRGRFVAAGDYAIPNVTPQEATKLFVGNPVAVASGKTLTASNTLTLAGTDGSTLNVGAGGTLGSNAFTSTAYVPQTTTVNGHALSGNVTVSASDLTTGTLPIAQVPTGTSSSTVAIGNAATPGYAAPSAISSGTTYTLNRTGHVTSCALVLQAGTGAYTANIALSDTGAVAGDQAYVNVTWPASTNPTLNVYDSSTSGTLLVGPLASTLAGGASTLQFVFNGTAWTHFSKGELASRNANLANGAAVLNSSGNIPIMGEQATGVSLPTRMIFLGDSITYGGVGYGGVGWQTSFPAQSSNLSFLRDSMVWNFGEPSQNASTINSSYTGSGITTTVTTTAGSTAATVGSSSGFVSGMAIGASTIPVNTTFTWTSGTSITLSQNATTTGTSVACAVSATTGYNPYYLPAPAYGYNYPNSANGGSPSNLTAYTGTPHLVSPAVSGASLAIANLNVGTNDYVEWGVGAGTIYTGNTTASSNSVTGMSSTSGYAVGDYISGIIQSNGTLVFPLNTTITAISGSTLTLSANATTTLTGTPITNAHPSNITASESNLSSLVGKCLADGDTVLVDTLVPNWNTTQAACQNFRLMWNNYIYSTWGGAAHGGSTVSGVTLVDLGTAPEFQITNPTYLNYYQSGGLHPSDAGYTVIARYINYALCAAYPTWSNANLPGLIPVGELPGTVPYGINGVYSMFSNNSTGAGGLNFTDLYANAGSNYTWVLGKFLAPNMTSSYANQVAALAVGHDYSNYNCGTLKFNYVGGSGSSSNQVNLAVDGQWGMTLDGNGNATWGGGSGTFNKYVVSAGYGFSPAVETAAVTMTVNDQYVANGGSSLAFTLPTTAAVGTTEEIIGNHAGAGWTIAQNAGQTVYWNGSGTTTGTSGYVASANPDSCVKVECTVANTTWEVTGNQGTITLH